MRVSPALSPALSTALSLSQQWLRISFLGLLLGIAGCSGGSGDSSNVSTTNPDDIRRLFETDQEKANLIIDWEAVLAEYERTNSDDNADDNADENSVVVRWESPARREDNMPLAERDILGYVIVFFKESDLADGILGGRIGSLDEFRERDEQIQRLIPPHEIMNVLAQDSSNLRLVNAGGSGSETFDDLSPGRYYLAMSTIDWRGMAGEFSRTLSKTIR